MWDRAAAVYGLAMHPEQRDRRLHMQLLPDAHCAFCPKSALGTALRISSPAVVVVVCLPWLGAVLHSICLYSGVEFTAYLTCRLPSTNQFLLSAHF